VDCVVAYQIRPAQIRPDVEDAILRDGAHAITFTSGSSVKSFDNLLPNHKLHHQIPAICIGPVTAQAAQAVGWQEIVVAEVSSVAGLVNALAATLPKP
jgi:uroporphyrinogen III methyltransferase/synthase